jgi:hypothetical protein
MAAKTPRFQINYPTDGAQGWWNVFRDFAVNVDALLFKLMEANAWTWTSLPNATITAVGGGVYQLSLSADAVLASRTFQTSVSVSSSTPLTLQPNWLITATIPGGTTGATTVSLALSQNGVTLDPDVRVLGVVKSDYSILWWNGSSLEVGATQGLFAFAGGSSPGGGAEPFALITESRALTMSDAATILGVAIPDGDEPGTVQLTLPDVAEVTVGDYFDLLFLSGRGQLGLVVQSLVSDAFVGRGFPGDTVVALGAQDPGDAVRVIYAGSNVWVVVQGCGRWTLLDASVATVGYLPFNGLMGYASVAVEGNLVVTDASYNPTNSGVALSTLQSGINAFKHGWESPAGMTLSFSNLDIGWRVHAFDALAPTGDGAHWVNGTAHVARYYAWYPTEALTPVAVPAVCTWYWIYTNGTALFTATALTAALFRDYLVLGGVSISAGGGDLEGYINLFSAAQTPGSTGIVTQIHESGFVISPNTGSRFEPTLTVDMEPSDPSAEVGLARMEVAFDDGIVGVGDQEYNVTALPLLSVHTKAYYQNASSQFVTGLNTTPRYEGGAYRTLWVHGTDIYPLVTFQGPQWNRYTGGAWSAVDLDDGDYSCVHAFLIGFDHLVGITGVGHYATKEAAYRAAPHEIARLMTGNLRTQFALAKPVFTFFIEFRAAWANSGSRGTRWVSTPDGVSFRDWRRNSMTQLLAGERPKELPAWNGWTTSATPAEIFLDAGYQERCTLSADAATSFEVVITARNKAEDECVMWTVRGLAQRTLAGASALVDSITKVRVADTAGASAWDVDVSVTDSDETLRVTVTGASGKTIAWSATGRLLRV